MEINKEFIEKAMGKPRILGIIADVNQGKSMLIYNLIDELKNFKVKIYTYGLREECGTIPFYSIDELESIRNSIVFCDEFFSLFDLDNSKYYASIEKTMRLIHHNNNILILCGLSSNFKKFLSNKLDGVFFKKCTIGEFINGSRVKNICLSYKGYELGTATLNIPIDKTLFFDGNYKMLNVKYLEKYDTKLKNKPILQENDKKPKPIFK